MYPDLTFEALAAFGAWSVPVLWLPLLLWTLFALGLYVADARLALRRPLVRQRLLVAALVALPLGLALRAVQPTAVPNPLSTLLTYFQPEATGDAAVSPGLLAEPATALAEALPAAEGAALPLVPIALGAVTLLLIGGIALGFALLAAQHLRLHRWLGTLPDATTPDAAARAQVLAASMGARGLRVRVVEADVSPFTYGWRRPVVVLPAALRADVHAWRLALAHEVAHVRNGDALWHGLSRLALACVPWHPLARRLDAQAALRREQAADAFVLGRFPTQRRPYAHLLLRYGTLPAPVAALSASVHHLHPRVHAMKHVLDLRARGIVPALLLACSLSFALSIQAQDAPPPEVFMVVEQQPTLVGGLEAIQNEVQYPEIAKRAGVQGRVIVQFVVDEEGKVQDAFVVRGIGAGADEEALRVVRAATFTAGKQRGKAVKVQMTLPITFRLQEILGQQEIRLQEIRGEEVVFKTGAPVPPPPPPTPGGEVFVVVEQMPELVGGLSALTQRVRYPQLAKDAGVEGRVIVQFLVDKDGSVQKATVVRGVGSGLDEEALRVVRAATFRPGVQRGQTVKTRMTLPITFKLNGEAPAESGVRGTSGIEVLNLRRTGDSVVGRVIDGATGDPLVGANVVLTGTNRGTATDVDGRFVVRGVQNEGATLSVSFVGFEPVTLLARTASTLDTADLEEGYTLAPGVPNPFSKDQEIAFSVPQTGPASLEVFNALGQRVAVLFNGAATAGQTYRVTFSGEERESGLYVYRLTHHGRTMTRTGTLAR